MLNEFNLSFVFLVVIAYSIADVPKCNREVPVNHNFDKSKMEGDWYVIETGDEDISKRKCMTAAITNEKGVVENSFLLREIGILDGNPHEHLITIGQVKSTSQFEGQSSEIPPSSVWVVGTDYTSYGIWFLCKNGHPQDGILYVTAKDRVPGEEVMQKAHESLAGAGFKTDKAHLFAIDHSNC